MKKRIPIDIIGFIAVIIIFISSCERANETTTVPLNTDELGNVKVLPVDDRKKINLDQDKIYGITDEIYINHIGRIAVDIYARVYISDWGEGTSGVYVFDHDGSFIGMIGRTGRGPGEYMTINDIQFDNRYIYLLDIGQFKIEVFSLDSFEYVRTVMIQMDGVKENGLRLGFDFFVLQDGSFFLTFLQQDFSKDTENKIAFHQMDSNGIVSSESIFLQNTFQFYQNDDPPGPQTPLPFTMPFTRSSTTAVSDDGTIYSAWSEEFLVKIFNSNGVYERALYIPFQNSSLTEREAIDLAGSTARQNVLRDSNLPDSWPALHFMTLDDKNNIWVCTITDDQEKYEWWVLDQDGNVNGTFNLSGKRSERIVEIRDNYVVSGNRFYRVDKNSDTDEQYVIGYNISWDEPMPK